MRKSAGGDRKDADFVGRGGEWKSGALRNWIVKIWKRNEGKAPAAYGMRLRPRG